MHNYNLNRFITAQQSNFDRALLEIQAGQKKSHWIWYIFPQLRSLGRSSTAIYYGIADFEEAIAYMAEPYLRENLIKITKAFLALDKTSPKLVMGYPDDLKLCSCMTLFEIAAPDVPAFGMVLNKFYDGIRDYDTIKLLEDELN
ncbi:MAG: DUF1810 domain-containing protein [Clostridiales bacterium]|nr:DUF1810 domain-containing protein [Clostridiales bacterium]